jgi:hypothetical protein
MNREELHAAVRAETQKLSEIDQEAIRRAFGEYIDTPTGDAGFVHTWHDNGRDWKQFHSTISEAAGRDAFRAGYLAGRSAATHALGLVSDRATLGAVSRLLAAIAEDPLDQIAEQPERRRRIGRAAVELTRLLADEWFGEALR